MVFVVARMKRVAVAARILFRLLNELMSYIFLILDLYRTRYRNSTVRGDGGTEAEVVLPVPW